MRELRLWAILVSLLAALAALAACGQPTPGPALIEPDRGDSSPGSEAGADVMLTFGGKVERELALSLADLQAMGVTERTIEHPKSGQETYTGVLMTTLVEEAEPGHDDTLTFTASDAYAVDISVRDVMACSDCMVAFDGDTLRLVMPTMGSSFWVKDVISVEAK